jgi:hypothetical protein
MALVTRAELQATLNIGTLYPNDVLDQIIGAAENNVLALLIRDRHFIDQACCTASLAPPAVGTRVRFRTTRPHFFEVDTVIRIGEFPRANWANRELTVVEVPEPNIVVAESSTPWNPGVVEPSPIVPNGLVYREAARAFYDAIPEVREAALAIAVDIFQSRVAPGGQMQGIDFTPGPYRLGRSLFTRVSGLLSRWTDTGTLVG